MKTSDVIVENHGSIFVVQPLTAAGREWIEEHVQSEPYQWLGGGLCVEHRYVAGLVDGMIDAGLEVS